VEVCRQIRAGTETRRTPVIMLTARSEEADKIRGLETGADDYVVKPFAMSELVARIRALLRRTRPELLDERLEYGDLLLDRARHRVTRSGQDVHLGPTEYRLLDFLMQRPGRVFSRERLLDAVWGANTYVELRTVDVHVGRLRKALRKPDAPDLIRTVRSAGYALDADV
jgi:two-component system phosphate regulon response regulator PhoB